MISKAGYQRLRALLRKKERRAEGRFMVEGWRSLETVLNTGIAIDWLLVSEEVGPASGPIGLLDRLRGAAARNDLVTREEMGRVTHSITPSDLAAVVTWSPMKADALAKAISSSAAIEGERSAVPQLVVIADGVSDPGNLGTLIRTADWFGARGFFVGPGSVEMTNPKVVQSTMGSLFQVPVGSGEPIADFAGRLKALGYSVASLEPDGATDIRDLTCPDRLAVIVGNEARGVSEETRAVADHRVRIPRFGRAESLNAAASVAAILGFLCLRSS